MVSRLRSVCREGLVGRGRLRTTLSIVCAASATLAGCAGGASEPVGSDTYQLWKVATPNTFGGPAADQNRYYVGASSHELIAINRRTKSIQWRAPTAPDGVRLLTASVVLAAGVVVMGDRDLFGYEPATGALRWRYLPMTGGWGPGVFGLASDGVTVYAGSVSGDVFAVDGATGAERWRAHLSDVPETSVYDPVVNGGVVYVGFKHFSASPFRGGAAAVDAATGRILWVKEITPLKPEYGSGTSSGLAVTDDFAIIGNEDGRVIALARADGTERWATERLPELTALNDARPVVLAGSSVIAGSDTEQLCAYDAATGALRWKVNPQIGSISLTMVTDGERVYIPSLVGALVAVDVANGHVRWTRGTPIAGVNGPFWSNPLVVGDTLVVPGTTATYGMRTK